MTELIELPFNFLRVPNIKLRLPNIRAPGKMTVFAFVFLSYFLVSSGIIYDVIVEPPSLGSENEGGSVKPVIFLKYRINGQFIVEGLSAGFLFAVGGLGFILLDKASRKGTTERNRNILLIAGALCAVISYNLLIVFLRKKLPGYQRS